MDRSEAEALLLAAGKHGDDGFPLLEAAIACALHEAPSRDPAPARDLAAQGVERLVVRLKTESPEEAIAETMAGDLQLGGDLFTLEDPENADILGVTQRRRGLLEGGTRALEVRALLRKRRGHLGVGRRAGRCEPLRQVGHDAQVVAHPRAEARLGEAGLLESSRQLVCSRQALPDF